MSSVRSTERSLTLLALNAKTLSGRLKGKQTNRASGSFLANQNRNYQPKRFICNGTTLSSSRYSFARPKIKCYSGSIQIPETKLMSTISPQIDIPLLNPAKLSAGDCKELVIPPIAMPRTMPRFPSGNLSVSLPSVTKVLQATMPAASRFLLDRWKESMIKKLGVAGFNQYQKDTFERGRALHAVLANYLLGSGEPTTKEALSQEVVNNLWKSIKNVVNEQINNVRLVEHIVTHSDMNYRGIIDCVAFYKDELVVIDFKTAEKPKNTVERLYDNPIQVTAYCGALNNDRSIPNNVIDRNVCSGLVIVAYVDGSEASTYYLNSEQIANNYWKQWKTRLDQYCRMEAMQKQYQPASKLEKPRKLP